MHAIPFMQTAATVSNHAVPATLLAPDAIRLGGAALPLHSNDASTVSCLGNAGWVVVDFSTTDTPNPRFLAAGCFLSPLIDMIDFRDPLILVPDFPKLGLA